MNTQTHPSLNLRVFVSLPLSSLSLSSLSPVRSSCRPKNRCITHKLFPPKQPITEETRNSLSQEAKGYSSASKDLGSSRDISHQSVSMSRLSDSEPATNVEAVQSTFSRDLPPSLSFSKTGTRSLVMEECTDIHEERLLKTLFTMQGEQELIQNDPVCPQVL